MVASIFLPLSSNSVFGRKIDPLRASVIKQDQRAFNKCHVLLGAPASEVYGMLVRVALRNALSKSVFNLYKEFKEVA